MCKRTQNWYGWSSKGYLTKIYRFSGRCPCSAEAQQTRQEKTHKRLGQQPGAAGHQDRPTRATNRHSKDTQTPTTLQESEAPGRQRKSLPFRFFDCTGSWVGALCLLLGSGVGARGQCTEPSRLFRRHLRALTLPAFRGAN